jgi:hypothetical protein
VGNVETNIFDIVQQATVINAASIVDDFLTPLGTVEAIINGGSFAAQGLNAPHWQYQAAMAAAINDAIELGHSLPHRIGY